MGFITAPSSDDTEDSLSLTKVRPETTQPIAETQASAVAALQPQETLSQIPTRGNSFSSDRVTLPPDVAEDVHQTAVSILPEPKPTISPLDPDFNRPQEPNLADLPEMFREVVEKAPETDPVREAILAALKIEKIKMRQIAKKEKEANDHVDTIRTLLDLSSKLTSLGDQKGKLPADIKALFAKLKGKGIDLYDKDEIPSKEKRSELKSLISSRTESTKTLISIEFNNMQTIIQAMNSMNESAKSTLNAYIKQFMATVLRNQRP